VRRGSGFGQGRREIGSEAAHLAAIFNTEYIRGLFEPFAAANSCKTLLRRARERI
jgi:hypothetical protein